MEGGSGGREERGKGGTEVGGKRGEEGRRRGDGGKVGGGFRVDAFA